MESSAPVLPVQQLHCHRATTGLQESRMGEKPLKLRGEKNLKWEEAGVGYSPWWLGRQGTLDPVSRQSHPLLRVLGTGPVRDLLCGKLPKGPKVSTLRECSTKCAGPEEPSGAHPTNHFYIKGKCTHNPKAFNVIYSLPAPGMVIPFMLLH